jgi:hypothetical protein
VAPEKKCMKPTVFTYLRQFAVLLFVVLTVSQPALMGQAQTVGQWTTLPDTMPINPIHVALLYNGKVLVVAGSGNCPASQPGCPGGPPYGPSNGSGAALWDPATGTITQFNVSWDMFCNGMVVLPDGRPFINGGTLQYDPFHGSPKSSVYDPSSNSFKDVQNMAHGRWYPTVLTLGDGRIMTTSGLDENGNTNTDVEFYTPGQGWSPAFPGAVVPNLYPRMHLLPNGKVFVSGWNVTSTLFDPATTTWTFSANTNYGNSRTYGTSVLLPLSPANNYDPKVIIMGGDNPATNTTEIIDMGSPNPAWNWGPNMSEARIEMNAVILPTGKVLAIGGSVNDEDTSTLSLNADLYDPATNKFVSAGANSFERLYHSVALLLPDGTVWLTGGNPERGTYEAHMEIYQPAYLFNADGTLAARPTITTAPSSISPGTQFTLQTPDASNASSVVLVRNGSVTHAFGMDQRLVGLSFTATSGALTVTVPANSNIVPPGYYMLFLVNSNGVPSVARFVQVLESTPAPLFYLVQSGSGPTNFESSASSITASYPQAQVAGDLNVVAVGWGDATSSISSLSDTLGNTYTRAVGPTTNTGLQQSIYYAKNVKGGTNTVKVQFSQAATYPDARILEYSGVSTTSPLDVTAAAAGSGSIADSSSATTTSANDLIFGAGTTGTGFSAAGSGFTLRMINMFGNIAEDEPAVSPGTYNATANNGSALWVMQMVAFRVQGGSPNAAPTVTAISPSSGTTSGGTSITITGTGFLSGASVTLGGTAATSVNVGSSTSITATAPAHVLGAVNVVIINTDGQSGTLASGYTYVSPNPAPTVTGISPTSGPTAGGTSITITGTGFLSGASVTLEGTVATAVNVASGTSITAATPVQSAGAVNVVVTNTDGQNGSLSSGFTYVNSAPTVTAISPASGTTGGGTSITVTGKGFVSGASVTLGGTAAIGVNVSSSTSITATTPAHVVGAVNVVVTNIDGQSGTLSNGYTYTSTGITFVQVNSGPSRIQLSASSIAATYSHPELAADLNVVVVGWGDTTSSISSVTDSLGNIYIRAVGPTRNTALQQSIYYAKNIIGGSNTVTVTFNQAATYPDVRILEYTGASATSPLDVTAAAAGTGKSATSGAAVITSPNELIFGAGTSATNFSAAGSGFTSRIINIFGDIAEDKQVNSTGSYSATGTNKSSTWVMQMATFR